MIIRSINLHPFAGVIGEFNFSSRMNVFLGPNEAGKSTLVRALLAGLFQSTNYGRLHWKNELSQFVPQEGGDTFRVSLEFEADGVGYKLLKAWGGVTSSELILPAGHTYNDVDQVDQQVADLLKLKQGTWKNVLISKQAALSSTLRDLDSEGEEAGDLAQLLRRSAFATDGVSIEQLEILIQDRVDKISSHWDIANDIPEKGRGIERRWATKVGTLLESYYHYQQLLAGLIAVEDHERNCDSVNSNINNLISERDRLDTYVDKFGPMIDSAKEKTRLTFEHDEAENKEARLIEIQTKWPRCEHELEQLRIRKSNLEESLATVKQDLDQAQLYEKTQSIRDTFAKAKEEQEILQEKEKLMGEYSHLSPIMFADLETAIIDRDRLAASIEAGKLQLRFTSINPMEVNVQCGLEEARNHAIDKSMPLSFAADGRIVLTTAEWTLDVESGDGDFLTTQESYKSCGDVIDQLLDRIKVQTIEEARSLCVQFDMASNAVIDQRAKLDTILDGHEIEELQCALGTEAVAPQRSIAEINQEYLEAQRESDQVQASSDGVNSEIEAWKEEFTSADGMLDLILDAREKRRQWEKQLEDLPTVSEEIDDLANFTGNFESKRDRLQHIKETELPEAKNEQTRLSATEPDQSTPELNELIADAAIAFEAQKSRLRSLQRVADAFDELKSELDSETLDPWRASLSDTIRRLTDGRYQHVNLDEVVARRASGIELPHELLSMGTRSSVGLALRLSMASHFLEGMSGFLVLDDPMVDLDLERQQLAADVLKDFAQGCQMIVFTCHPAHAALLSETPVKLERLA